MRRHGFNLHDYRPMKCDFKPSTEPDERGWKRWKCSREECGFETAPTQFGPDQFHNFPPCRVVGWGDVASYWLTLFGITKGRLQSVIGGDCGCTQRQESLNTLGDKLTRWWKAAAESSPQPPPAKPS